MAETNVTGWSGVVTKIHENNYNVGFTTLTSDGYDFDVFFNAEDLYIYGEQCNTSYWNGLKHYAPVGTQIHFDAERFRKPVYEYGYNAWYQASLVWIGSKPRFDEDSSEDSDDDSDDDENIPDVTCRSGKVIAFVNQQRTAILESTIDNRVTWVALERCRFYEYDGDDGEFYQPDSKLNESLDIDDWVQFEAFYLDSPHACGVTLRVGLGWVGYRPDYDPKRPTHLLRLPNKI